MKVLSVKKIEGVTQMFLFSAEVNVASLTPATFQRHHQRRRRHRRRRRRRRRHRVRDEHMKPFLRLPH